MADDASKWVSRCPHCQVAQGTYTDPKPKIGQLESNSPLDLLCLDFTKVDPSKTGKGNVLVMTDAFSKFSVAVVTPNQKHSQWLRPLWKNGSTCMEYRRGYIVIKEDPLTMKWSDHFVNYTVYNSHSRVHTILGIMLNVSASIEQCSDYSVHYPRTKSRMAGTSPVVGLHV